MSGYTPVFDSVFDGTLSGRWPTLPVWLTILPLADKHGHIDLTYQAIASRTGWPLDLLRHGIAELMAPDPDSRTPDNDGRRLEPLDPNRSWGWRVVNHTKYAEKVRKINYDAKRTASGQDAARKQAEREASRDVPTCPDVSRDVPLSSSSSSSKEDSRRAASGEPELSDSLDKALFVEARKIFGGSIGGQINKAIRTKGKPFVVSVIEACRRKDPEAARAYLNAALKGSEGSSQNNRRRHPG